jgi:phage tail-like protein
MASSTRQDPLAGYNFRVELDGIPVAHFMECLGLGSETEVIKYREGGDPHVRLIPGLTTYSPITLKRGLVVDRSLWEWRKRVADGLVDRRNGSVTLLTADGKEVARWTFQDGWPSKWLGPDLNAQKNEVAIETLEIVHERLNWEA